MGGTSGGQSSDPQANPKPSLHTDGGGSSRCGADDSTITAAQEYDGPKRDGHYGLFRQTTLKILNLNVHSFRAPSRRDILEAKIEIENYDILLLTETWLTNAIPDSLIQLQNYDLAARADRPVPDEKNAGGGVLIYTKKGIKPYASFSKDIDAHAQIASVKIGNFQLAVVYRAPGCKQVTADKKLCDLISSKYTMGDFLLAGDMNLPTADWKNGIFKRKVEKNWHSMATSMNLTQIVDGATQDSGNQLDLILVRSSGRSSFTLPEIDDFLFFKYSDHYSVSTFVTIEEFEKKKEKKVVFDHNKIDWLKYREDMKTHKVIPKTYRENEAKSKWCTILNCLTLSRETSCPKREIVEGKAPVWMSRNLQKSMQKERRLRKHATLPANSKIRARRTKKWKFHHSNLKKEIVRSRVEFETKQVMKIPKDCKVLFNKVKSARRVTVSSPPINDVDGNILRTDQEKANAFQDKFVQVFSPQNMTPIDWPIVHGGLNDIKFTPSNVKFAIGKMRRSASPGADEFGPAFYKECDLSMIFALCDFFTHSMQSSEIPDSFLCAKVVPIWKQKGSISDIKTHRGVTLGDTGFKVQESVIMSEINEHLEKNDLIDTFQHGFQKYRSTVTNLFETWEFISSQIDKGHSWVSVSADFSCAFDTLCTYKLLMALKSAGIGGVLGKFLDKWMRGRSQYVQVGEAKSYVAPCSSGVSQGSLGGPQLFCLLLSSALKNLTVDGAEEIDIKMMCFADDTRFLFKSENQNHARIAQNFIDKFVTAVSDVGLKINASKSVVVYYGKKNFIQDIFMDGVKVPVENHSVELGCVLSNSMNFKLQLERNINKASRFIYIVRSTFKVRTYEVLEKLYYVYFCPILLYTSQIWLTEYEYMKDALYRIYRKFWRLGGGYIKPKDYVLDPYQMAIKQNFVFMFQMYKNKTCLDFNDYFNMKGGGCTRSHVNKELEIQRNKYVSRDNFFTTMMARKYNELPECIRESTSVEQFKFQIKGHIKIAIPTPYCNFIPWFKRKKR